MDPKVQNSVNIIPPSVVGARPQGVPVQIPPPGAQSFRSVLGTTPASEPLKFSAHAAQRLQSRNISITPDDLQRMNEMADKAAAKGSKQSLFMMGDVGMIVSIKNRTVITAVDSNSMKDNVFTNIDSAAVIR